MANETILSQIEQYIPIIWEEALDYVRSETFMPSLVLNFMTQGRQERRVTVYNEGVVDENLGELEDMTPQALTRALLARLTPAEHGMQYLITDARLETDDVPNLIADAAEAMGASISKHLEQNLLGHFNQFTGGTIGTAGQPLTWTNVFEGSARLAKLQVPKPYSLVLDEMQWLDLANAANMANVTAGAPLRIRDDIQSNYYVGSTSGINIFTTPLTEADGSDDVVGGMFNRNALALDMRRGFRIEPERDASKRATELNGTIVYASGVWRADWGVKILSDATLSGSAVTVNSVLVITGSAEDLSLTGAQVAVARYFVTNTASQIATGIEVDFTIDADFTITGTDVSQGSYASGTWIVGDLAPGETARITVNFTATDAGNLVATVTEVTPAVSGGDPAATLSFTHA